MNHQPTFSDEAVEVLAKRLCRENGFATWSAASERVHEKYRDRARSHLDALTPFLVQGRVGELSEQWRGEAKIAQLYADTYDEPFQRGRASALRQTSDELDIRATQQPHPAPLSEQDRENAAFRKKVLDRFHYLAVLSHVPNVWESAAKEFEKALDELRAGLGRLSDEDQEKLEAAAELLDACGAPTHAQALRDLAERGEESEAEQEGWVYTPTSTVDDPCYARRPDQSDLLQAIEGEIERQNREVDVLSQGAQKYPVDTRRRAELRAKHEAVSKERDRLTAILNQHRAGRA